MNTNHLELFRSLIKDGCYWAGDVDSKKYCEVLYFRPDSRAAVERTLSMYAEGTDYKLETGCVWIV